MVIKGCARCGGDLYDEHDVAQVDLVCLQCGFRRTIASTRSRTADEDTVQLMRWLQTQRPSRIAA